MLMRIMWHQVSLYPLYPVPVSLLVVVHYVGAILQASLSGHIITAFTKMHTLTSYFCQFSGPRCAALHCAATQRFEITLVPIAKVVQ